jgi:hypothetical protein
MGFDIQATPVTASGGRGRFFFGGAMPPFTPYRTEAEIEEVVQRFETCAYTPQEFLHARHLTVAAWYFLKLDTRAAEERMRAGLLKFIRHHGKNAYHETITEFWLRLVNHRVQRSEAGCDSVAVVNEIVIALGDKNLIYKHFSPELVESTDAKAAWVIPDLAPMPLR